MANFSLGPFYVDFYVDVYDFAACCPYFSYYLAHTANPAQLEEAIVVKNAGSNLYECEECKMFYREKSLAEKCEAWCKKYKSCNLEIVKYAIKTNR
jgi:hypothetical protein